MEHRIRRGVSFQGEQQRRFSMKVPTILLAAAALVCGNAIASAEGASDKTPGQQMQDKGSVKGSPGASGYAPGQKMQEKGSVKGTTGASGYAPGHTKSDTKVQIPKDGTKK
jgi:hypothetical protein